MQTVGGCDHRLHTLKPTDSSPPSIHLSRRPYLCFSLSPPPPRRAPSGGHGLQNPPIHSPTRILSSIHPSIHLPPSRDLPIVHLSLSGTYCSIRSFSNMTSSTRALLPPDTSRPHLPPSSRAEPPTHAYFPLMLIQLPPSPPISKPQTTGL